ncbi:MAG TPA: hypothetical protein VGZ22_09605 [Isosphaeraceae bacterium]|jgi:hypothetical protein|nr:hypothetical protein [Isosphaeraceae bacterium]
MMIGGIDLEFLVRGEVPVADIILRTVRRHWPEYIFENADDPEPAPLYPRWPLPNPTGTEFFIYRDPRAAKSWARYGATKKNAGLMIHVLLGEQQNPPGEFHSMTIVVGDLSGEIKDIIDEVEIAFRDATESLCELNYPLVSPEAA